MNSNTKNDVVECALVGAVCVGDRLEHVSVCVFVCNTKFVVHALCEAQVRCADPHSEVAPSEFPCRLTQALARGVLAGLMELEL